jgi:formate hydrogenlyase subunit 3/multisubunit Na+/H+ antiporter MnhD subunit
MPVAAVAPLVATLLGWCRPGRRLLPLGAVLALAPAAVVAVFLPDGTAYGMTKGHFETRWVLDGLGRSFLLFTVVGWGLAAAYASGYVGRQARSGTFWVCFLAALSGNLVVVLAGDALLLYSGLTLMGFAAWGLVGFEGTPEALRAGRVYLAMVVAGELLVLPALLYVALDTGSLLLDHVQAGWSASGGAWLAVGLLWVGFGIKAGMAPFHFWLPLAHPAAPTPASAVLSGCMIKTGLLAWLRCLPTEGPMAPVLALAFAVTGALNLVGGGLGGMLQRGPKAVLAYTSLQAMGLLMLMLACAYAQPSLRGVAVPLIAGYAGFHALHKIAFFLSVGVVPGGRRAPILAWLLLVALAASYAGLPGLGGDRVKQAAKPLWESVPSGWIHAVAPVLALGTCLTLALAGYAVWLMRPRPAAAEPAGSSVAAWCLAAAAAIAAPLLLMPSPVILPSWEGVLPLAAGALVAFGLGWLRGRVPPPRPEVPHKIESALPGRGVWNPGALVGMAERQLAGPASALVVLGLLLVMLLAALW